jgi:GNAT superfamily N-acetyltransferase
LSPVQRWRAWQEEFGSRGVALQYAVHRVLQKLSGGRAALVPYLLVAQPLVGADAAGPVAGRSSSTVVERAGPKHPAGSAFPRPPSIIEQRFADGAECHVALVKGEFAGYIWISRNRHVEDEVRCTWVLAEPAASVWDHDVYVEPRFRLGRTMARLWQAVDETLHREGVRWTFSRISRFNSASIRSHQRLGARPVGTACFLRIGRLQLMLSPRWHLSLGGAGPDLTLTRPASTKPPRA